MPDAIEQIVPAADSEYFKREVEIAIEDGSRLENEINPAYLRGRKAIGRGDWIVFHKA